MLILWIILTRQKRIHQREECKKGVQDEEASSDKQMFCLLHYAFGVSERNILACKNRLQEVIIIN